MAYKWHFRLSHINVKLILFRFCNNNCLRNNRTFILLQKPALVKPFNLYVVSFLSNNNGKPHTQIYKELKFIIQPEHMIKRHKCWKHLKWANIVILFVQLSLDKSKNALVKAIIKIILNKEKFMSKCLKELDLKLFKLMS